MIVGGLDAPGEEQMRDAFNLDVDLASFDKLHLGCGSNLLPGWLNTDANPYDEGIFMMDATEPFPFESDQFKERFKTGNVIPIWFSDAPSGIFDETRKFGGLTLDVTLPLTQEVSRIVGVLLEKLVGLRGERPKPVEPPPF